MISLSENPSTKREDEIEASEKHTFWSIKERKVMGDTKLFANYHGRLKVKSTSILQSIFVYLCQAFKKNIDTRTYRKNCFKMISEGNLWWTLSYFY